MNSNEVIAFAFAIKNRWSLMSSRWAVTKWFNPLAPAVWVPPKIRFNVFDSFTERQQWVHKCAVLCAWSIRFRRIMENWILYVCILIIWIYLTHLLTMRRFFCVLSSNSYPIPYISRNAWIRAEFSRCISIQLWLKLGGRLIRIIHARALLISMAYENESHIIWCGSLNKTDSRWFDRQQQ